MRNWLLTVSLPLALISVIFFALTEGPKFGFCIGAFAGLLFEVFGTGKAGIETMLVALCGAACGFFASKIFRESFLTQLLLPSAAVFIVESTKNLIFLGLSEGTSGAETVLRALVSPSALSAVFVSPLVFALLRRFSTRRSYAGTSRSYRRIS